MLISCLFRPGCQVGPTPNDKNNSSLVLGTAKLPGMGWQSGKATGFEATRPGLWTVGLSLLSCPVSTPVVIIENPGVAIHHTVTITLG